MNARESENYLAISRSSSESKSVEIGSGRDIWGTTFSFIGGENHRRVAGH
jgi:hypothetical protein